MEKTDGNDPITATVLKLSQCEVPLLGLTKREHFAAMAMQGLASTYPGLLTDKMIKNISCESVKLADALITALNQ